MISSVDMPAASVEEHRQEHAGAADAGLTMADVGVDGDALNKLLGRHGDSPSHAVFGVLVARPGRANSLQ